MSKGTLPLLLAISVSIGILEAAQADRREPKGSTQILTAQDHVEIQQLVARYGHALDNAADNGNMFAALFTPDGVLIPEDGKTYTGRANLREYARRTTGAQAGSLNARHFSFKAIVEPSPSGATGKTLVTLASIGRAGQPATAVNGGQFWDEFVKTPEGWRIKKRTFVQAPPPPR
jgi:hypothetical protein